ncbi:MAG: LysR family transcriptional regulator [Verrucomicrobiales bacterium]
MLQPLPNLHHLELFFHVAQAGGITAAVRSMPYGIQQPAVSGQISQLEEVLGVRLFQRRPFELTPAGRELYEFTAPFFGGLGEVVGRVTGAASKHLRLAAPATVIREYLPEVLAEIRGRQPDLELSIRDVGGKEALELLEREEVDLVVTELEGKPPSGSNCELIASLPLVLLLPPGVTVPRAGLESLIGKYPLIRPPAETSMSRLFAKGLTRRKWSWSARMELGSIELINVFVARGFGIGIGVAAPHLMLPKGVVRMPLEGFPELKVAALWRGKPGSLTAQVIDGLRAKARTLLATPE